MAAEVGCDGIDIWEAGRSVYRKDFSPFELKEIRKKVEITGCRFLPSCLLFSDTHTR
jgi:hypothetical protein